MPPRIPRPALRQLPLARAYATPQAPPAPFSAPVSTNTPSSASSTSSTVPSTSAAASSQSHLTNPDRVFPIRKGFLYDYYGHLLRTSPLFLVFEFDNLSVQDWSKLRNAIKKITIPEPPAPESIASSSSSAGEGASRKKSKKAATATKEITTSASLTVIRTGVFSAAASQFAPSQQLEPWLLGQRAVLHSEYLSPPYLKQVLATVKKTVRSCQREGDNVKQPALNLVVGLMENRLMPAKQVEDIASLPDMQALRGQLVGGLEMPGRSLLGLLGQAGGGGLLRTLQGLEQGMKEKEGGEPSA
ncbi:hypothetical protein DB88DRAFT_248502 [Papiliotrema laurentii]|uniref:Uncharacterized protein n=1 Tax=Papiliotrema laurentii TaxID=5418 RepID=A0AAD9FRX1_PAPLA|nr:hypothetical protein DB88DRAFT_248502 [Papiliotrema laurentii]